MPLVCRGTALAAAAEGARRITSQPVKPEPQGFTREAMSSRDPNPIGGGTKARMNVAWAEAQFCSYQDQASSMTRGARVGLRSTRSRSVNRIVDACSLSMCGSAQARAAPMTP
jgi:hypothetical protein